MLDHPSVPSVCYRRLYNIQTLNIQTLVILLYRHVLYCLLCPWWGNAPSSRTGCQLLPMLQQFPHSECEESSFTSEGRSYMILHIVKACFIVTVAWRHATMVYQSPVMLFRKMDSIKNWMLSNIHNMRPSWRQRLAYCNLPRTCVTFHTASRTG